MKVQPRLCMFLLCLSRASNPVTAIMGTTSSTEMAGRTDVCHRCCSDKIHGFRKAWRQVWLVRILSLVTWSCITAPHLFVEFGVVCRQQTFVNAASDVVIIVNIEDRSQ